MASRWPPGWTLAADGITADFLDSSEPMEAVCETIEGLFVIVDVDGRELYALLVGLGVFSDHCLIQFRASLGALG